jgi:UDP:flavonoid glycosyltransferase YjiC (YdhE family)
MRAVILTLGSRGDVEPYVALGRRMAEAGFDVAVATHTSMHDFVTTQGLAARTIAGDPRQLLNQREGHAWLESAGKPKQLLSGLEEIVTPILEQGFQQCIDACRDAEVILASWIAVVPALAIAQESGKLCIPTYTLPAFPTGAYPSVFLPFEFSLGRFGNRITHVVAKQFYWRSFRHMFEKMRRRGGSFPNLGRRVSTAMTRGPALLGMSPLIVPSAPDDPVKPTGFWVPQAGKTWSPPQALLEFLAAGPPPVCIGFGSMTARDPEQLAGVVRDSIRATGKRAIVLTGWGALAGMEPERDLFVTEQAPHGWLLPRVSLMVHHGGPGTVGACLRAGIPSISVPFFADQRFWGSRLYALGVSPAPIPRSMLTADRLAQRIHRATADPAFAQRAAQLAQQMVREDGEGEAIRVLDRAVNRRIEAA